MISQKGKLILVSNLAVLSIVGVYSASSNSIGLISREIFYVSELDSNIYISELNSDEASNIVGGGSVTSGTGLAPDGYTKEGTITGTLNHAISSAEIICCGADENGYVRKPSSANPSDPTIRYGIFCGEGNPDDD